MGPLGQREHSDHLGNIGHDDPDEDDDRINPPEERVGTDRQSEGRVLPVSHRHGDDEEGDADRYSDARDLGVEEKGTVRRKEILTR